MVCKKCGTMITDGSTDFCPACCAPLGERNETENLEDILKSDHSVDVLSSTSSYTPQLGIKWANFLGYFALWAGAIIDVGSCITIISLANKYFHYSGAWMLNFGAICGLVSAGICVAAALAIINQKKNAGTMVTLVHVSNIVVSVVFALAGLADNFVTSILIQVLFLIINQFYFEKRTNIFVN